MIPQYPSPEWALDRFNRIVKSGDPDSIDALIELLAGLAPDRDIDRPDEYKRYKYDAAWAAIYYGFTKTTHCESACREYLGIEEPATELVFHRSAHLTS